MDTINIWNFFNLHSKKIVILFLFVSISISGFGQNVEINLPNYDEKPIHYGISFGLHSSSYKLKYSDAFIKDTALHVIHSINPQNFAGFSLGLLLNVRLSEHFDFRLLPKVTFYENYIEVNYTDGRKRDLKVIDPTMVEGGLYFKYKSSRRGNIRMYWIGGISAGKEASGKKSVDEDRIKVQSYNYMGDFGFGLDLYFPLFKLSPELRFSKGLVNIHRKSNNEDIINRSINRLSSNTVTFYLNFE